jgi:hypothetical protein
MFSAEAFSRAGYLRGLTPSSSVDDVIAAVDIERIASDQLCPVHRKKNHCDIDVLDAVGQPVGRNQEGLIAI